MIGGDLPKQKGTALRQPLSSFAGLTSECAGLTGVYQRSQFLGARISV